MTSYLDNMGLKFGTDKASNGHGYLDIYEKHLLESFFPLGHENRSLLELGWWDGASMRMWREFFPAAWTITGLDIEEKEPVEGVNFVRSAQNDAARIADMAQQYGPWDVIVDDASHISPLTISSFKLLWPHLKPGGLYFVEDLQVSYHTDWLGHPNPTRPGPQRNQTTMQFLHRMTDAVHFEHAGAGPAEAYVLHDVARVAFYPGLCVVEKGEWKP